MNATLLKTIFCWIAMLILSSAAMLSFAAWVLVSDSFVVTDAQPAMIRSAGLS